MQNSVERDYRRFAEKNAVLRYLSKVLVLVKERRKDSSLQMYESRLSYFNDKARINYCKPLSVYQHGGPSRPRQNCHSCTFETKENSNFRICIQYLGHHYKTTCQKSAKSMRYRVRPEFKFYRKSPFKFFQMNTILAWKKRLVRGLRFKTKSFNSRAVDGL